MTDLYVSWEEYHRNIEKLAVRIDRSRWRFDQIVCLARGGLRVGDILCRLFRQPLAILYASSYGGANDRSREGLKFSSNLAMMTETLGERVLLVDDLADSGMTLKESLRWLHERYSIAEIRTAVLWYKGASALAPDYYVEFLPDNPWIHQPFEKYERIAPRELEGGA